MKAEITLYRQELIYDIENQAYILGDLLPEEQQHTRHIIQDICQGGNLDRTTRIIDLAVFECIQALHPFVKTPNDLETGNDAYQAKTEYKFKLDLPESFPKSIFESLPSCLHEYIVWRVLGDWTSSVLPQQYLMCLQKMEHAKSNIDLARSRRTKTITRKSSPF